MAQDVNDTNKLGTYHISSELQNYEVARSNFFTLLVDVAGDGLSNLVYPDTEYLGEGLNDASDYVTSTDKTGQELIKLSVKTMFVPHFSMSPIEVRRGNSSVKFADVPSWQAGSLTVQDFVGLKVKTVLMAWQALAYDVNTDTQGRAGDWIDPETNVRHKGYKKNCVLIEYSPDFEQIRYWDLIGCWISNITENPFEVDGNGGREITVQLEYDRAIMHRPDSQYSGVAS